MHCLFYRTSKKPFSQYREILLICNLPTLLLRTKKFDYQQRNGLIKKETKRTKKIIHSNDRCSFYHRHDVYLHNEMRVTLAVVRGALLSLTDRQKIDWQRQTGTDRRTDRDTYTTH